jgi:hypothetical protein
MSDRPGYFSTLGSRFVEGWNRFWFTPSDPTPLAVLRIGIGLIALYLVATFGFDLKRYFDPESGLLPLDTIIALRTQTDRAFRFSYLDYAADGLTLQMMHYAGVAVIAAFVAGLWTRVSAVLTLVVFLSYYHRAPALTSITEPVVAYLLLYLCLGPCGAVISIDAWRKRRGETGTHVVVPTYGATIALRLIQVHTALAYFLMFCGKQQNSGVWWSGTAVWWLIARPESALVNLRWLSEYPYVINFWTTAIFLFEPAFALLIWNRTARPLLLGLSAVIWAGTALITGLVPFCLAMFLAGLSFADAETWRTLIARRRFVDSTPPVAA